MTNQSYEATSLSSIYKKYRVVFYLIAFIGLVVLFKNVLLQAMLIFFLLGCITFILFKAVVYLFKFGYLILYGLLSIVAFVVMIGGIAWITTLF